MKEKAVRTAASASFTSKDLELATTSQGVKIAFEPREFWKRKDSANPLTAASTKSRKVISTNLLMDSQQARSSWSVVASASSKGIKRCRFMS